MEVLRHDQNSDKIERLYAEIIEADKQSQVISETQLDRIDRLAEYYIQQYDQGVFVDKNNRKLEKRDICRTMVSELNGKVSYAFLREVYRHLPPEYKKVYAHNVDTNSNLGSPRFLDSGNELYFSQVMESLDIVKNAAHEHLTRDQERQIFEKIYDVEQAHEEYCDNHNIALIDERKQNQFTGTTEDDPCKERVRMFEPEPRAGVLYEKMCELVDATYDCAETVKKFPMKDLQMEIKCARAIDSLLWYFQFLKNKKYRRDSYGWAAVMKKSNEYGTKAGAAKMTAVPGYKERERDLDKKRKVTREQLANNFEDMPTMYMKFIEWHPYLHLLHEYFAIAIQPIRADLSIDLRTKLRYRKGTITKEQVLKLMSSIKGKKKEIVNESNK